MFLGAILAGALSATPAAATYDHAVRAWFGDHLKDPGSAVVELKRQPWDGSLFLPGRLRGRQTAGRFACYRVNAKNSYGGFVGWTTYVVLLEGDAGVRAVYAAGDDSATTRQLQAACEAPA